VYVVFSACTYRPISLLATAKDSVFFFIVRVSAPIVLNIISKNQKLMRTFSYHAHLVCVKLANGVL